MCVWGGGGVRGLGLIFYVARQIRGLSEGRHFWRREYTCLFCRQVIREQWKQQTSPGVSVGTAVKVSCDVLWKQALMVRNRIMED